MGVVAIHLVQAVNMARKCERNGVERGTKLWWKWVADVFFEGSGAHARFNGLVEEEEKKGRRAGK